MRRHNEDIINAGLSILCFVFRDATLIFLIEIK